MPWDQPRSIDRSSIRRSSIRLNSIRRSNTIGSQHSRVNSIVDCDTLLRLGSHIVRLIRQVVARLIWIHSTIVRLLASTSNRHSSLRFRAPLDTRLSVAQ